jgi:transcriptional regulator with XRE-family HTH domain
MRQNTPMCEAMKAKGMTLRQLSLQTGMKPVDLSAMEHDCLIVAAEEADLVGRVLGIDLTYMLDPDYQKQVVENIKARELAIQQLLEARRRIEDDGRRVGSVTCPACQGVMRFRVHSNGHVWALCETKDCIGWIE